MRLSGISLLLIAALLICPPAADDAEAATPWDVHVQVNESLVQFPDAKPYIDPNGRVQVPLRFVSEQLGYHVDWRMDGKAIAITLQDGNNRIELTTGSGAAFVNGNYKLLDTVPYIADNRVFVPLRFLGMTSGLEVHWGDSRQLAFMHSPDIQEVALMADPAPRWKRIENVQASAYSASALDNGPYAGLDYMGNKLKLGTVAVDPGVIPLGSELYIEGYDFDGLPAGGMKAKATDVGGAIKGNKIDIFIPGDRKNALRFGLQKVNVYIKEQ